MSKKKQAINQIKREIKFHKDKIKMWEMAPMYTKNAKDLENAQKHIEVGKGALELLEYILVCVESYEEE